MKSIFLQAIARRQELVVTACLRLDRALLVLPVAMRAVIPLLSKRGRNAKGVEPREESPRIQVGKGATYSVVELVDALSYDMYPEYYQHSSPLTQDQLIDANISLLKEPVQVLPTFIGNLLGTAKVSATNVAKVKRQLLGCVTCILITQRGQEYLLFSSEDQESKLPHKNMLDLFVMTLLLADTASSAEIQTVERKKTHSGGNKATHTRPQFAMIPRLFMEFAQTHDFLAQVASFPCCYFSLLVY